MKVTSSITGHFGLGTFYYMSTQNFLMIMKIFVCRKNILVFCINKSGKGSRVRDISTLFFMRRRYGRKRKVGRTRRFRKGSTTKRFARIAKSVFNRSVETKEARYTYSSVGGINFHLFLMDLLQSLQVFLVQLLKVLAKHSVLAILFMLGSTNLLSRSGW